MVTKTVRRMAAVQLDRKTMADWQPDMHGVMRLMFNQLYLRTAQKALNFSDITEVESMDGLCGWD